MGLTSHKGPEERLPCGFCFVEYYDWADAELAV